MVTVENILVGVFFIFIFLLLIVALLFGIKWVIIQPLSYYYTKRGTNKLQWRAEETSFSRELRINSRHTDNDMLSQFHLEWRILPSELPYIVRVYGFNDLENFRQEEHLKFKNEQEFKHFVSDFKTLKDLREYYNKVDDKIVWYEP